MKNTALVILVILLSILNFHQWRERKEASKTYVSNLEVLNDSISHFKNKQGLWVAERKVFQGNEKQLKELIKTQGEQLTKAVKSFKKPKAAVKIATETEIDTVFIPYKIELPPFNISFNEIKKHYSINGFSTEKGIFINSLTIPNEQSVVVGKKKIGFLKYEYRAEVTNSNPLVQVTELTSFNFKEKKNRFHLGPFAGIGSNGNFTFGFGVSYSLLSF